MAGNMAAGAVKNFAAAVMGAVVEAIGAEAEALVEGIAGAMAEDVVDTVE